MINIRNTSLLQDVIFVRGLPFEIVHMAILIADVLFPSLQGNRDSADSEVQQSGARWENVQHQVSMNVFHRPHHVLLVY